MRPTLPAAAALAACSVLLVACSSVPQPPPPPVPQPSQSQQGGPAPGDPAPAQDGSPYADMLASLPTIEEAGGSSYDRGAFDVWSDPDGNGCDTRDDILARDLQHTDSTGCWTRSGVLDDPYTATRIQFIDDNRGGGVDIDHVVPLRDAWLKGASGWAPEDLARFGNDPANLLAVDAGANRSKGDDDAGEWLPDNRDFWCQYAAIQVTVKHSYGLGVDSAERSALSGILAGCPSV